MMKTILTISYIVSLYFAGGLVTTLLDVWMWKRGWTLREDKLTDTLFALLWPLYLPILILALLYRGTSFLVSRIREAAGQEAQEDEVPEANTPEYPHMTPYDNTDLVAAREAGKTLRRILQDKSRNIGRVYLSFDCFIVLRKSEDFVLTPWTPYIGGIYHGIPIEMDPDLSGYCFYWKEKF